MPSRTRVLERDDELAELAGAARRAATGAGSVVLVSGEAGIGKSSLVAALQDALPEARLLTGRCDDLATPRVLGPLRDLSGAVGADLARALRSPASATPCSRRCTTSWTGRGTRPCSRSRTCTGRTRRRSTCCAGWAVGWPTCLPCWC